MVADLGDWPGHVVGVDLVPIDPLPQSQVETLVGDLGDPVVIEGMRARLGRAADLVLSDAAPKLSGVQARDEVRCEELSNAIVGSLSVLLASRGALVMKTFMGSHLSSLQKQLRERFDRVQLVRPQSSRQGSSECYVVALRHRRGDAC